MLKPDRKAEQLLRQFLNHDGPKGASNSYKARYDYAFKLTAKDRLRVDQLVNSGLTFEEAFAVATDDDEATDPGGMAPIPIDITYFEKK